MHSKRWHRRFVAIPLSACSSLPLRYIFQFRQPRGQTETVLAGAPPDVQKIVEKVKAGQPPTPAEMQPIQEWASQLNGRLNYSFTIREESPK